MARKNCKTCKDEIKMMCRLGTDYCSLNCEKKDAKSSDKDPEFALAV